MMIKRKKKDLSEREELEIKDKDAKIPVSGVFIHFFNLLWHFLRRFGFVLLITAVTILYCSGFIIMENIFSHFSHPWKNYIISFLLLSTLWFLFFRLKGRSFNDSFLGITIALLAVIIIWSMQKRHNHTIAKNSIGYVKPARIIEIDRGRTTSIILAFKGLDGQKILRNISLAEWMPTKKNKQLHENDTIIIVHPIYSTLSDFILVKNFYPSKDAIKAAKYHPVYYKEKYYKRLEDLPLGVKYVDSVFIYEPAIKSLNLHTYF